MLAFFAVAAALGPVGVGGFGFPVKLPMFAGFPKFGAPAAEVSSVGAELASLLGGAAGIDASFVALKCAEDVIWEDLSEKEPAVGRDAVEALLRKKYPAGARLNVGRTAGTAVSGGCTWRRERVGEPEAYGLRGTTFARKNDAGLLVYVREGNEPIFKPGEYTEKLLKAVTANAPKVAKNVTFVQRDPNGAADVVTYLWDEAYPRGASPAEALRLFAEDIVYEDFNYPASFVGKAAVKDFIEAFDIPGIAFVPTEISGGGQACCFTWQVTVNGNAGPKGISFYEVDSAGKVCFIRDIPAASLTPPPLTQLAALKDPQLRVFTPRPAQ